MNFPNGHVTWRIEDILDRHAADLNAGQDTTRQLFHEFGPHWPELGTMLALAAGLKRALTLRQAPRSLAPPRLETLPPATGPLVLSRPRLNRWFLAGAAASLVAGGAGLFVWWRRGYPRRVA